MIFNITRMILGIFFCFTGIVKLIDLQSFRDAITLFDIMPSQLIIPTAIIIPSTELFCGFSLFFNVFKRSTALILSILMTSFIAGITINLLKQKTFECGCFGFLKIVDKISWNYVIFDIGILILLLIFTFKETNNLNFIGQIKFSAVSIVFISLIVNIPFSNQDLIFRLNETKITEIDWNEVSKIMITGKGVLIDGRNIKSYNRNHVRDAISIPLNEFNSSYNANKDMLLGGKKLIVYCDNETCGTSKRIAHNLILKGHTEIYTVKGGITSLLNRKNK